MSDDMNTEAERIKARLRNCRTPEEVERVADEERAAVKAMAETADGKPLARVMKEGPL